MSSSRYVIWTKAFRISRIAFSCVMPPKKNGFYPFRISNRRCDNSNTRFPHCCHRLLHFDSCCCLFDTFHTDCSNAFFVVYGLESMTLSTPPYAWTCLKNGVFSVPAQLIFFPMHQWNYFANERGLRCFRSDLTQENMNMLRLES